MHNGFHGLTAIRNITSLVTLKYNMHHICTILTCAMHESTSNWLSHNSIYEISTTHVFYTLSVEQILTQFGWQKWTGVDQPVVRYTNIAVICLKKFPHISNSSCSSTYSLADRRKNQNLLNVNAYHLPGI